MDDNWWHQHDIMGGVIMKLHSSLKWVILIELQELHHTCGELQLCNFIIHATCPLTLMAYKNNEL
jgi:hypothetical protein